MQEENKEIEDEHEKMVREQRLKQRKEPNKLSSSEELNHDSSLDDRRLVDYAVEEDFDDVDVMD